MSDANTREPNLLIIRRGGSAELESPKGGVWKIAYADFMTAMMAFFLVMWLINATSETTKTGVANYFNPIKLADGMNLPRKGLHDPAEDEIAETEPAGGEPAEAAHASPDADEAGAEAADPHASAGKPARFTEEALFRDPYAVLAAIAAEADGTSSLVARGGGRDGGAGAGDGIGSEPYGDPFDPASWHIESQPAQENEPPAEPGTVAQEETLRSVQQPSTDAATAEAGGGAGAAPPIGSDATAAPGQGGISELVGGSGAEAGPEASPLREKLAEALGASSRTMPHVTVESADGGVLISLADQVEFGMFAIGSAEPLPETIAAMEKIAALLQELPGKVIIRGHTDGRPFRSGDYDNWRLSSARAHMAYHMLVRGGLDEGRVERIEGYADRDLKLPDDPDAAENRRIDILVQELPS